jgi:hypothetical protein
MTILKWVLGRWDEALWAGGPVEGSCGFQKEKQIYWSTGNFARRVQLHGVQELIPNSSMS